MTTLGSQPRKARVRLRLVAVLTAVITLTVIAFSLFTLAAFDRAIAPEVQDRTRLIGTLIRLEVQRALELGIPMAALGGLDAYIEETIADFPEVRRIAIKATNGTVIAEVAREQTGSALLSGRLGERLGIRGRSFRFPVLAGSDVVGAITIEGSAQFAETRLRDVMLDVGVLAIAILLIGVELTLVAASASVWKPQARMMSLLAEQRAGTFRHVVREAGVSSLRRIVARLNDHVVDLYSRVKPAETGPTRLRLSDLNDIRLPLFLFALATEITASFLPIYAAAGSRPDWIPHAAAAAAPLFLYLFAVAVISPPAERLAAGFGPRRLFIYAIPFAIVGLAVMAMSQSVIGITLGRGLIALVYALAIAACQSYALGSETAGAGRPSSAIVGAIFGGAFCGSVIGGVVAGRFGYPVAVASGMIFALGAGLAGYYTMRGTAGDPRPAGLADTRREDALTKDPLRFGLLLAGVSIPASAVTAVFIWYLTPLLLSAEGLRPADIARVVMLYYLAAILVGPLASELSERSGRDTAPVLAGLLIAAISLLSLAAWSGDRALTAAVLGVGIGHALMRAPLLDLAIAYAGGSVKAIGLVRMAERLGAMAGLGAAALLVTGRGGWNLPAILGIVTVAGGMLFAVSSAVVFYRERYNHEGR